MPVHGTGQLFTIVQPSEMDLNYLLPVPLSGVTVEHHFCANSTKSFQAVNHPMVP